MSEVMNNLFCPGIVIDADTIPEVLAGTYDNFDPLKILYSNPNGHYKWTGTWEDPTTEPEGYADLEGMEAGAAICRQGYDDNNIAEFQKKFCCQTLYDETNSAVLWAYLHAGYNPQDQAVVDVDGVEVSSGAEVFASANAVAASFMTMAAAATLMLQWDQTASPEKSNS